MGREELEWHQLAYHKGLIFVHTVKLKPIIKAQISGKLVTRYKCCSNRFSKSEKTHLKKMIMIIIISMKKKQEKTGFGGGQKLTSAMK